MTSTHALTKVTTVNPDDVLELHLDPANSEVAETERGVEFGTFLRTYNRSPAEKTAGLSNDDLDFKNEILNVLRYGENTTPGTTDMDPAFLNAILVANVNGGDVIAPANIYLIKALRLTVSHVHIVGDAFGATILKQGADSHMITIDATTGTLERCGVEDITFLPNGFAKSAIYLTGGANRNDYHTFKRILAQGTTTTGGGDGFHRTIQIDGRTIWTHWEDIDVGHDRDSGFWCESGQPVNLNTFINVQVQRSQKHGFWFNFTDSGYFRTLNFYSCNAEENGRDLSNAKNSGFYFTNVGEGLLDGCGVENNGNGSTDNLSAALRTEGLFGGLSIHAGLYWGSDYSLKLDAALQWGHMEGFRTAAVVKHIDINATNSTSSLTFGGFYFAYSPSGGSGIQSTLNVNSDDFVAALIPFKLPVSGETLGSLSLARKSLLRYANSSPVSLTDSDFSDAAPGHILWVCNDGSSTVTLTHGSDLIVPGGANLVLANAQSAMLAKLTATKWLVLWWSHALSAAYTPTNVTTDRSFDADTVAIAELADVVGTMIADLQTAKLLR